MSEASRNSGPAHPVLRRLLRKNVLAGLMFIAIASLGLWLSRDYPIGTLRRMSTGFMPQMLCWLLMGLGGVVLLQGLLAREAAPQPLEPKTADHGSEGRENYGSIAFVALSLVAFALTIETLGLVVAIAALVVIASFAYRGIAWWETIATAAGLTLLCWLIFVLGIGMTVKIFPEL